MVLKHKSNFSVEVYELILWLGVSGQFIYDFEQEGMVEYINFNSFYHFIVKYLSFVFHEKLIILVF